MLATLNPLLASGRPRSSQADQAGRALLEALIGVAAGTVLVSAALSLHLAQLQASREALHRQRQSRDAQDLLELLRREIRRAGYTREGVLTAEQQAIVLEGSPGALQLHYRSDPIETDRPTGRASFRLAQGVMQWRTPATGGYQSLLDAQSLAMQAWTVQTETSPSDCRQRVRIRLTSRTGGTRTEPGTTWETLVQRRNHGGMPCEAN